MSTAKRYVLRTPTGEFIGGGPGAPDFCSGRAGATSFGSREEAEAYLRRSFRPSRVEEYRVYEVTPDGQLVPA
jgi:hypothetical protein